MSCSPWLAARDAQPERLQASEHAAGEDDDEQDEREVVTGHDALASGSVRM